MKDGDMGATATKPLWRRIADFPLVAMIIAVALFAAMIGIALLIYKLLPPGSTPALTAAKVAILIGLELIAYKLVIRHLGEQQRDDLPWRHAPKELGIGLLSGLLIFTLIVGVAGLLDVYNIVGEGGTSDLVMIALTISIMPGFMEELFFRGILFRHLEQFGGSWFALAITSALFGIAHIFNPNASAISSFAIAIEAGILLGGAYMITRRLWVPMALHAAWNFTQGFIWDVPVSGTDQEGLVQAKLSGPEILSGGAFGLEASLIAMVVATLAGVWLVTRAVRQGKLVRPWWVRRRIARENMPAPEPAAG